MNAKRTLLISFPKIGAMALFTLLYLLGPNLPSIRAAESVKPPNVILIMTDDQGYGDLGCHGNSVIQTPHLDTLHDQSIRLTQFHVDPTCSPTRSALMTGRYSTRTGVWHTIMGRSILYEDEVTLADLFKQAGYRTGMFGKWHLGDNYPFRPTDRGFDIAVHHGGGGITQTPDAWGNDYFDDTYLRNNQREVFEGYCTDVFFREARQFITSGSEKPFFCYLATNAPHGPFNVEQSAKQPYLEKGVPEPMASFYAMITNIDQNLGSLMQLLEERSLSDNTLVLFMTDNGTAAGYRNQPSTSQGSTSWGGFNAGMRGTKGSAYDGGHRVPCFWRWPAGKLGTPRDIHSLTGHIDILPTLADICHLDTRSTRPLDGISLLPLLKSPATNLPHTERTLVVHSQRIETPRKWKTAAVMTDRWRLIDGRELYDIQTDPGQREDVGANHPDIVAQLRDEYNIWWSSLQNRLDTFPFIVLGNDQSNPSTLTAHDWHGNQVPWNQRMLRNLPEANGYWAVRWEKTGWYRIRLRHWPKEAPRQLDATKARIRIGDLEQTMELPPNAQEAIFTLYVEAGEHPLQTWLDHDEKAVSRGAFFVEIKAL